jgi:hypothetical protein
MRRSSPSTPKPKRPGRPPDLHIEPDRDYVADLEQKDPSRWKRLKARDRGKPVKPPQPRNG